MDAELVIGHVPSFADVGPFRKAPSPERAKLMCNVLIDMLRRQVGHEASGVSLRVEMRTFGTTSTYVVVCQYAESNPVARDYAFRVLRGRDTDWDARAKALLRAG